jgi:hypothetical protein
MNKLFFAFAASAALGSCLCLSVPALADTQADVNVTAAFYASGGGPGGFSIVRSITSMIGEDRLQTEMEKLASTYGQDSADAFPHIFDYALSDGWMRAGRANVMIPPFGSHEGIGLANDLLRDGTAPDGTFQTSYLFDRTLTPKVHAQVKKDIVAKYGADEAATFEKMANQFFFDVSQLVGSDNVSLAPNH